MGACGTKRGQVGERSYGNTTEIEPFTPDEARTFIKAVHGERLEALYVLAIATGMRQAELLGLSWTDIDLDGHQLTVRTTLQRIRGEYLLLEPKTARSHRTLPFPEIVADALKPTRVGSWGRGWLLVTSGRNQASYSPKKRPVGRSVTA